MFFHLLKPYIIMGGGGFNPAAPYAYRVPQMLNIDHKYAKFRLD